LGRTKKSQDTVKKKRSRPQRFPQNHQSRGMQLYSLLLPHKGERKKKTKEVKYSTNKEEGGGGRVYNPLQSHLHEKKKRKNRRRKVIELERGKKKQENRQNFSVNMNLPRMRRGKGKKKRKKRAPSYTGGKKIKEGWLRCLILSSNIIHEKRGKEGRHSTLTIYKSKDENQHSKEKRGGRGERYRSHHLQLPPRGGKREEQER